jgi:acyl-CoA synthetase (AMP-forming)/AMP-acid ligase II
LVYPVIRGKPTSFQTMLEQYRGNIIDVENGTVVTSSELQQQVEYLACQLHHHGVRANEPATIVMSSGVRFITYFLALMTLGAVPVLLSKQSRLQEITSLSSKYGIPWLVSDTLQLDNDGIETLVFREQWRDDMKGGNLYHSNVQPNNIGQHFLGGSCFLQPTSGSTGEAKMCVRSGSRALEEPLNHYSSLPLPQSHPKVLCPAPLNHAYGFGSGFLLSFICSADLVLLDEFHPRKLVRTLTEQSISTMIAVPAMLDLLTKMRLPSHIRMPECVLCAGAPLERELSEAFHDTFGCFIRPAYGSTETGEITVEREAIISDSGSVGAPLAGSQIKLIPVGNEGFQQLWVKNPSRMEGYLGIDGNLDRNGMTDDGWFPTGDIGTIREDGRLVLQGRIKHLINVFGIKVNPLEVSAVIRQFPGIEDVHVYAGKHRSGSDLVYAIAASNRSTMEDAIIRHCQERLAPQKVPVKVFVVDRLPRSQTGKLMADQLPQQ